MPIPAAASARWASSPDPAANPTPVPPLDLSPIEPVGVPMDTSVSAPINLILERVWWLAIVVLVLALIAAAVSLAWERQQGHTHHTDAASWILRIAVISCVVSGPTALITLLLR
jgi:uncharacterized membrane protein